MADLTWTFEDGEQVVPADNKIIALGAILRLSALDPTLANWSYHGKYYESTAALYAKKAEAVRRVYGFFADFDLNDGAVAFRLSSNGGTTWFGWNGAAWVSGGPFASLEDVDRNIPSWNFSGDRNFSVQVKLTPSADALKTPIVRRVSVFAEMPFGFIEDIERSLATYLKEKVRAELMYGFQATANASVTIPGSAVVTQPVRVFNLTADPGKRVNLFSSLAGRVVNFVAPQTGSLLIEYNGQVPVHIDTDEDFQIADKLAYIIRTPTVTESRIMRDDGEAAEFLLGGRDLGWGLKKFAVVNQARIWFDCSVVLSCYSTQPEGGKRDSAALADALDAALEQARNKKEYLIYSRACGEQFQLLDKTPVTIADRVIDKVFERRVSLTISGRSWVGDGELKQLVEDVEITVNTFDDC
jgi:hypothetical protein